MGNPSETRNSGSKLMGGDIRILSLLSMMMVLFTSPEIDISSQVRKCPSSKNGQKLLLVLMLVLPSRLKKISLLILQLNAHNSSSSSNQKLMKSQPLNSQELIIHMATPFRNFLC